MFQRMLKLIGWVKKPVVASFATTEVELSTFERGSYAHQALHNPIIMEALDELEKEAMVIWGATTFPEIEAREFIWSHVKAIRQLRARLLGFINDAKLEEHNKDSRTGQAGNQE